MSEDTEFDCPVCGSILEEGEEDGWLVCPAGTCDFQIPDTEYVELYG